MADTCGNKAINAVIARNRITEGCFHQELPRDGLLRPIKAKMMLENPTTSSDVQNHDALPIKNAQSNGAMLYLYPLRKRDHTDKQFTAR
jgi:hypothetical protein